MDFPFISQFPQQFHTALALLAGLMALSGLVLWSAGIKVARSLSATSTGCVMAAIAGIFLPNVTGLPPLICAVVGLAAGLVIGITAFRMLQGVALAASLAILLAGGFYLAQRPAQLGASLPAPETAAAPAPGLGTPDQFAQAALKIVAAQWLAIPQSLRQQMMVIAAGAAILAFVVAVMFPKQTTWIFTACMGTSMILSGAFLLMALYSPLLLARLPENVESRLGVFGVLVLIGMLLQRMLFWPGKRQQQERARDHGEPVAA